MKLSVTLPDALVAQLDARDHGRGRSATLAAIVQRYNTLVRHEQRMQPPSARDLSIVTDAAAQGLDADGAAALIASEPLSRVALIDAAEQAATAAKKGRR